MLFVKLWVRLSVAAGALYVSAYGAYLLFTRQVFAYQNFRYRAVVFSPAVIASGILVAILAFIPTRVVERLLGGERSKPEIHPHYRSHHHDSSTHL
jgi:hypothetical protein